MNLLLLRMIAGRLAVGVLSLLAVSIVVFTITALLPGDAAQEQLGATHDSGQRVVDVVCDAKGKLAEGSHLLAVDLLFTLRFMLCVGFSNEVETAAEACARGVLL